MTPSYCTFSALSELYMLRFALMLSETGIKKKNVFSDDLSRNQISLFKFYLHLKNSSKKILACVLKTILLDELRWHPTTYEFE